jgi:hypothetical protein
VSETSCDAASTNARLESQNSHLRAPQRTIGRA